jgi:iron complex outermembrane recepter protein
MHRQQPRHRRPMADSRFPVVLNAMSIALMSAALAGAAAATTAHAQNATRAASDSRQYNVRGGPLSGALNELADQADVLISAPAGLTAGKTANGVVGAYSVDVAFRKLLAGTGLEALRQADGSFSLRHNPSADGAGEAVLPAVSVVAARGSDAVTAPYAGGQVARGASAGLLGERDYMDTPFSIASYTSKLIRDEQSTSVAELLTTTDPSVRAAIDSSNRYDALTIRGLRVENDEMSLNGLYGLVPDYRVGPDPVERVEILKGPGALLNGMLPQGSIGGSVNVLTKRADDTPLTRLTGEYISNSVFGAHADIGRRFGPDNRFGIRLNAAHREGDTEIDEQSRRGNAVSLGMDYRGTRLRASGDVIY